jgi:hypothetical protein
VSSLVENDSVIRDNAWSEIVATRYGFPQFIGTFYVFPWVSSDPNLSNHCYEVYLLRAYGDRDNVRLEYLSINIEDPNRFYPNLDIFIIGHPYYEDLCYSFAHIINYFIDRNFSLAFDAAFSLIENHPYTSHARRAISFLPHLIALHDNLCVSDFIIKLEQFYHHPNIAKELLKAISLLLMFSEDYYKTIYLLEQVILDPPSELIGLLAQLDQIYAYMKLQQSGARTFPITTQQMPVTTA